MFDRGLNHQTDTRKSKTTNYAEHYWKTKSLKYNLVNVMKGESVLCSVVA